jgi:maleylpyruvate isomerase
VIAYGRPVDIMAEIEAATARLYDTIGRLTDADARQPSRLPGWTRGHVLTHIARGGNALRNVLQDAPAYPSQDARDADIEAGAGRPIADLEADVRASADAFRAAALTRTDWDAEVSILGFAPFPTSQLLLRRLVELELHHVDLDAGYRTADWSPAFVALDLPEPMRSQRADRLAW